MALGPEYTQVEKPLIDQLSQMGWTHLEGAPPGTPAPVNPSRSCTRAATVKGAVRDGRDMDEAFEAA